MKSSAGESKVLALLDRYISACTTRPETLYVYRKQHASVIKSRRRHISPTDTVDHVEFKTYRGIPVALTKRNQHDTEET